MPHWNWEHGEVVRVCAFTNCRYVRLYLNDRLISDKVVNCNRAEWWVTFDPGTLRAEADVEGKPIVDSVTTSGAPSRIAVENVAQGPDADVLILNVALVDKHDVLVPNDDRAVCISIEDGILLGSGNGDPNGTQSDRSSVQMTFMGLCQFIVQPIAPSVRATISSEGLPSVAFSQA